MMGEKQLSFLLTIAIPTYNRLEYIQELLPNLAKQCESFPEVEILVSDNMSTDGSFQFIQDMAMKTKSQFRYRRNPYNVGGDENFVRCVEAANGDYVWLFGDDEQLCFKAISTVVETIKKNPALLVIIQNNPIFKSQLFTNYKEFVDYIQPNILIDHTLITCNIFRRELFNCETARKYRKTSYGHMYAIMRTLKKNGRVYLLNAPIISIRKTRAPFEIAPKYILLKHGLYLLYFCRWYPKVFPYLCRFMIGGLLFRIRNRSYN